MRTGTWGGAASVSARWSRDARERFTGQLFAHLANSGIRDFVEGRRGRANSRAATDASPTSPVRLGAESRVALDAAIRCRRTSALCRARLGGRGTGGQRCRVPTCLEQERTEVNERGDKEEAHDHDVVPHARHRGRIAWRRKRRMPPSCGGLERATGFRVGVQLAFTLCLLGGRGIQ